MCVRSALFTTANLTLVWCSLCPQFQPASTRCQRTWLSTKAATWLSPVLPTADRNQRSPGGCSTPQVRPSRSILWLSCNVPFILSKVHLSKSSLERQRVLWVWPRLALQICGGNKCGLLHEPESKRVTALWLMETLMTASRCDDRAMLMEKLYLYQLLCQASALQTYFITSICLLHVEAKPYGWVCFSASVCIRGEPFVCADPLSLIMFLLASPANLRWSPECSDLLATLAEVSSFVSLNTFCWRKWAADVQGAQRYSSQCCTFTTSAHPLLFISCFYSHSLGVFFFTFINVY